MSIVLHKYNAISIFIVSLSLFS